MVNTMHVVNACDGQRMSFWQVAALELGRVLPPEAHVPLASITTSPCNTTTLANQSMAAGSTASESACQVLMLMRLMTC